MSDSIITKGKAGGGGNQGGNNPGQIPQTETKRDFSTTRAVWIAALVTASSFFTYYLLDNLPNYVANNNQTDFDWGRAASDFEANYDLFRFLGGTYVGALLALLGSSELVERVRKPRP